MKCKITIVDEVNCKISGLARNHLDHLIERYAIYTEGYRFHPLVKTGVWDGKIRYFSKIGETYINLLEDIVPIVQKFGYSIDIDDRRKAKQVEPSPITETFFAERGISNPDNGEPWIMRDYQVNMVNALIDNGGGIGICGTGGGKDQPLDSNVLTVDGWKRMGDLTLDDQVITPLGSTSRIVGIFPQGKKQTYTITFKDGAEVDCGYEHLWKINIPKKPFFSILEKSVVTTKEIIEMMDDGIDNITVDSIIPIIDDAFQRNRLDFISLLSNCTNQTIADKMASFECPKSLTVSLKRLILQLGGVPYISKKDDVKDFINLEHPCFQDLLDTNITLTVDDFSPMLRKITSIRKSEKVPTQCIAIEDANHLYITDGYIATHNTSMTAALAKVYEEAGDFKSVIIVPDKNLSSQTYQEYQYFGLDVGMYNSKTKDIDHQHIVSTWQSLKNAPELMDRFDLVIVDECHTIRGKVLQTLLNEHGKDIAYRFGVTGTLPKADADLMAVNVTVGSPQYEIAASTLIEQGHLATLRINQIQLNTDLTKQYDDYCNMPDSKPLTYNQFVSQYFSDYASEKSFCGSNQKRLDWIANDIIRRRDLGGGNILCLVNGIAFGKKLAKKIEGAKFLSGADKMADRQKVYDLFKDNDDVVLIATTQIASTGLNIKRIFTMMFVDGGKSFIQVVQSIGRGLRKAPDKSHVEVVDIHSGFKYGLKHAADRRKFYTQANYPSIREKVDLSEKKNNLVE